MAESVARSPASPPVADDGHQEPCKNRVYCVALDLSAEFGILRQNEPTVVVTTVVSLVLYTLAQAPERVLSASLGVTAP